VNLPSLRNRAAALALSLGCGLALLRCDTQVAGSSVTTGNPTEIQVSFTGDGQPTALTGRVELYGATQIPVPGFQPEPLASFEVDGKEMFTLKAGDLNGIADSLWALGSKEGDSLVRFNLVVTGEREGAILRDLAYRIKEGEFALQEADSKRVVEDRARIVAKINPMTDYQAIIDPSRLDPDRLLFLFLAGTGYAAESDGGFFAFPSLPEGSHSLSFITLPHDQHVVIGEDTAIVYATDRPVMAGKMDTLAVTAVQFQVPMPDKYKP
jgi:hypothetical protein